MKFRFTLVAKLTLFLSIFIFFITIPLAGYIYVEVEEIVKGQVHGYLTSIAEAVEGQVYLFFDKAKVRTSDWSSDGYLRQTAEKITKERNQDDVKSLNNHLTERKLPLDLTIKIVDVIDLDMNIIASSNPNRVGMVEDEHIAPLKGDLEKAEFGEVFIDGLEDETNEIEKFHPPGLFFHTITPIKSTESGETIAVLLLHFTGDTLNDILSGKWQIGQGAKTGQEFIERLDTGEIYLVNENKLMVTPSRFVEDAVLKQKVDTLPVVNCLENGNEFVGEYFNYRNIKAQGASMCFSDHKTTLIIEASSDEIFAGLLKERRDFILVTTLSWVLGILVSILFGRYFLKNIKIIRDTAIKVGKGDFGVRAEVISRDEAGELAAVFNQMLDNIKQSEEYLSAANKRLQEVYKEIGKANFSLEEKVLSRTKELEDIKNTLEMRVHEKTAELEKRLRDLEKFRRLTIGRELRMIELKKELAAIKK